MTSTDGNENLLKLDERGKVRTSRERREAVLGEFDRSGLSGAKFAPLSGIKYPTFMYGLKQRRGELRSEGGESRGEGLVEALIEGASQRAPSDWLFIGDASAGERSAIIYTVIESCRRHGVDPFTHLRDLFERLPSATNWQLKDLTPAAWARAQKQLLQAAA